MHNDIVIITQIYTDIYIYTYTLYVYFIILFIGSLNIKISRPHAEPHYIICCYLWKALIIKTEVVETCRAPASHSTTL